jgi:autotransporter-associated beta strand protein
MGNNNVQMLRQKKPDAGTEAIFTVDGVGATARANEVNAWTDGAVAGSTAIVNLNNGGALEAERVRRSNTTDGTSFYLNFGGGVFRARTDGDALGSAANRLPTRVTAFSGGAVIDTQTNDVTWLAPIVRPEGGGIASIDLPAGITSVPSIGPGTVRIASSGSGYGASAVMDYDLETRQPTRIIVTSPGCGYEAGTTTVEVEDSSLNTYSATFTVAANATDGGLTKRGSGTLTLSGANTYGGATRVEGGTVVFSNASGFPGGDFEVPAAAIATAPAAPLLQVPSLSFSAGHGVRLTEAETLDHNTFGPSRTIASFTTPLADLPSLTVVDSDGTPSPDAGMWMLSLSNGGRALRLGVKNATMLILK